MEPGSRSRLDESFIARCYHKDWQKHNQDIRIDRSGTFEKLFNHDTGKWLVDGNQLILRWDNSSYSPEVLCTNDGGQTFQLCAESFCLTFSRCPPPWFLDKYRGMEVKKVTRVQRSTAKKSAHPLVAILVPFREQKGVTAASHQQSRSRQLCQFISCMSEFLLDIEGATFLVLVVEQSEDGRRFNRGKLLNVGFREVQEQSAANFGGDPGGGCLASVVFHDCDLLPSYSLGPLYAKPAQQGRPVHLSPPYLISSSKYRNDDHRPGLKEFFGGVIAVNPEDFEKCNGFPNDHWGWGQEDDQLMLRMKQVGAARRVERPPRGSGTFSDIDSISVVSEFLRSAEHDNRVEELVNEHAFTEIKLSRDWDGSDGLRGLAYEKVKPGIRNFFSLPVWAQNCKGLVAMGDNGGSRKIQVLMVTVDL